MCPPRPFTNNCPLAKPVNLVLNLFYLGKNKHNIFLKDEFIGVLEIETTFPRPGQRSNSQGEMLGMKYLSNPLTSWLCP